MRETLTAIVQNEESHAKWLNTLSYLENCGARKIAACEHPTLVKEEMLKHAAEEFRHAHHLKRQIEKISKKSFPTYCLSSLLGGFSTLHYLNALDIKTSRYLKNCKIVGGSYKSLAYLLVTFAIECRAENLYPLYHDVLKKFNSPVSIKSILLEEKEHLQEMVEGLKGFSLGLNHAAEVCKIESTLYERWIKSLCFLKREV